MNKKESVVKFDNKTVWSFGTNKIKVFIPTELISGFNVYCKKNNIKPVETGSYIYQGKNKSKKDKKNMTLNEGKDYILYRKYKEDLIKWLTRSYKEIK